MARGKVVTIGIEIIEVVQADGNASSVEAADFMSVSLTIVPLASAASSSLFLKKIMASLPSEAAISPNLFGGSKAHYDFYTDFKVSIQSNKNESQKKKWKLRYRFSLLEHTL